MGHLSGMSFARNDAFKAYLPEHNLRRVARAVSADFPTVFGRSSVGIGPATSERLLHCSAYLRIQTTRWKVSRVTNPNVRWDLSVGPFSDTELTEG